MFRWIGPVIRLSLLWRRRHLLRVTHAHAT